MNRRSPGNHRRVHAPEPVVRTRQMLVPAAAAFTAYWLLAGTTLSLRYALGARFDGSTAIASAAIDTVSLACVWLTALAAAMLLPLNGRNAVRNLVLTFIAAAAVLMVRIVLLRHFMSPLGWFTGIPLRESVLFMLPRNLLTFGLFWLGGWAVIHYRRSLALEVRATAARLHLTRARLAALTAGLEPHFIGNALHALSDLVYEAPDAARAMLRRLRKVITEGVQHGQAAEVRLDAEVDFVESWLDIQRVRFAEQLVVSIAVDEAARHVWIPSLILQPLVENVVEHAVGAVDRPVHLVLNARVEGGHLELTVEDDGPGLETAGNAEGVGITNTRQRLDVLYGREASLSVENRPGGGVAARIRLPSRQEPVLEAPPAGAHPPMVDGDGAGRSVSQLLRWQGSAGNSRALPASLPLLAATGTVLLAMVAAGRYMAGMGHPLAALASALLTVGNLIVLAIIAYRLPAWLPLERGVAARRLAGASAILGIAVLVAMSVYVPLRSLVEEGAVSISLVPMIATDTVSMWTMMLNVLLAGYVARHVSAQDAELRDLQRAEADTLQLRHERLADHLDLVYVQERFDRIEAHIGQRQGEAVRELVRLEEQLRNAARRAAHT